MKNFIEEALKSAKQGIEKNEGGPFGAVIVNKDGEIIGRGNNKVLKNNDPTAHAEIVAIRNACKNLNTYDLSECVIYTSCEPCPMCLSAIIWSNIKKVYYGGTKEDAADIGFRDDEIYDFIKGKNNLLDMKEIYRDECKIVMEGYKQNGGVIY